jgi:hypothetical protein
MLEDLEYTALREYCLNTSKKPKKKQVETRSDFSVFKVEESKKVIKPQSLR